MDESTKRTQAPDHDPNQDIDPPPFFRTWRGLYTAILIYLCVLIVGFTLFGRVFNTPAQ